MRKKLVPEIITLMLAVLCVLTVVGTLVTIIIPASPNQSSPAVR